MPSLQMLQDSVVLGCDIQFQYISSSQRGRCSLYVDVKAKQQVSSGGLGSGPAPEFCAGPTSPLSRSLSIRARCAFYRREHGLRLLEELSTPISNTTRTCWPNTAVSHCKTIKSLATDRNNITRQTVYVSNGTDSMVWPERTTALTGRLSPICNRRRCCATCLRENNVRIQHTHQANNASDAVNVLRPRTRLSCHHLNTFSRAKHTLMPMKLNINIKCGNHFRAS